MPRYSGILAFLCLVSLCIGINIIRYPAVSAMLTGGKPVNGQINSADRKTTVNSSFSSASAQSETSYGESDSASGSSYSYNYTPSANTPTASSYRNYSGDSAKPNSGYSNKPITSSRSDNTRTQEPRKTSEYGDGSDEVSEPDSASYTSYNGSYNHGSTSSYYSYDSDGYGSGGTSFDGTYGNSESCTDTSAKMPEKEDNINNNRRGKEENAKEKSAEKDEMDNNSNGGGRYQGGIIHPGYANRYTENTAGAGYYIPPGFPLSSSPSDGTRKDSRAEGFSGMPGTLAVPEPISPAKPEPQTFEPVSLSDSE